MHSTGMIELQFLICRSMRLYRASFFRSNHSSAQLIPPIPTHFFMTWSVVCHICAPCLNCSTDFDAIWQVHLWGPMTHCARWGSLTTRGREDFSIEPPAEICNCKLQPNHRSYDAIWQIQIRIWMDLLQRFPFCQITLVFVTLC